MAWIDTLVDDDGTNTTGTIWGKAEVIALMENIAEAGLWTPVIGGSGGTSGQTYVNQEGRYLRIGDFVWAACFVRLSNKGTITGSVEIQGLPFSAETGVLQFYMGSVAWEALNTTWVNISAHVPQGTSKIAISGCASAAANNSSPLAASDITNSTALKAMVCYRSA
jgi:hypothetical protein